MGFDIECIIDIHNYPGEYFCPVCRTLVYPNEALQSQCTHLYCKPCLAHVANNTRACPYDGYLVTEADSKPLLESDKALAENIGKVRVRCLYHRSGCTWEGSLSECPSHCSGCAFGNSPVICNRCGIQIVHRQVHEHAQSCPGVYQVQQAAEAAQNTAGSGPIAATTGVNQNQATIQPGAASSQAQISQTAPAPVLPGQDSNQQINASSQAPSAVSAAVPNPEQWYQQQYQQYQQYYQQATGYDLYQQAYQQYYPYQQSVAQQSQQHPVAHGGQPQLQVYSQAPVQAQMQPQSQSQVQPLPHSQPQPQQLVQSQASAVQPQTGQPHVQVQQGQSQLNASVQSLNPQTQNQTQVTPQQQVHPAMQPHAQIPSHSSLPHGFPPPQSQGHLMQPQSQHIQVPQYQQHPQPSQVQLQPHLQTQGQLQNQPNSQLQQPPHLQHHTPQPQMRPSQPNQPTALNAQAQPIHSSVNAVTGHQSYLQSQPLQQGQLGVTQQHAVHGHPTSGSLAPGQLHGQIPQQPPTLVPPSSHGPIATQQASFPSQGQVPTMTPAQQQQFHPQAPHPSHSVQQRPVVHSAQQLVPQQYVQQPPPPSLIPGQLHQQGHSAMPHSVQSQLRPQGPPHIMQPNPQSVLHLQQNVAAVPGMQPQQMHNYVGRPLIPIHGAPGQPLPPFPQTSGGFGSVAQARLPQLGSNQPSLSQNYAQTVNNQLQTASDLLFVQSGMLQRQGDHVSAKAPVGHEAGLPSQNAVEKVANTARPDSDGTKVLKSEAGMSYEQELAGASNDRSRQTEPLATDGGSELHGGKDVSVVPLNELIRVKEEPTTYSLEPPPNVKSVQPLNQKETNGDARDEELESHKSQNSLFKKPGDESLQSTHVGSPPASKPDGFKNVNPEGSQQTSVSARDQLQLYSHEQRMHHYGPPTNWQKSAGPQILQSVPPRLEVPGHPSTQVRPQGLGLLPPPRNPMNPSEQFQPPLLRQPPDVPPGGVPAGGSMPSVGGEPGYFGAAHGPSMTAVDQRDGIMGRAPQHGGLPHLVNPVEAEIIQSQKLSGFDGVQSKLPGSFGRGPFGPPSSGETSSFRMDGGPGLDSSLRSRDERFKTLPGDHLKPFLKDTAWPLDQGSDAGSRALERPPHGLNYDSGIKLGSAAGGPPPRVLNPFHPSGDLHFSDARERGKVELDRTHPNLIGPGRDYLGRPPHGYGGSSSASHGREVHSFGEGSRSYDLPPDPLGNSFHENRYPFLPSFQRRGEFDGSESLRFVEHVPPGPPLNHLRRGDLFGQDIPPSHFRRGELGPGSSPSHLRYGNQPGLPRLGEPGFRSSFSQGFPKDGPYAGGMDPFDKSRKRKSFSVGWCRICKVDCETVEGLDMHSQSREHQKMAMDMVMSIKQQNKKKPRLSSDRAVREETSKTRNTGSGVEGRGNKP